MVKYVNVKTKTRTEFVDITSEIQNIADNGGVKNGLCRIFVPHTTAGITINEGADPSVAKDILKTLNKLVPHNLDYTHMEGNSDAHIKTVITGTSQDVIIENGKLLLGTWQSIFFCEFDGPRSRRVLVKIIKSDD